MCLWGHSVRKRGRLKLGEILRVERFGGRGRLLWENVEKVKRHEGSKSCGMSKGTREKKGVSRGTTRHQEGREKRL